MASWRGIVAFTRMTPGLGLLNCWQIHSVNFLGKHKQLFLVTGLCGLVIAAGLSYWLQAPRARQGQEEPFRPVRYILRQDPITRVPHKSVRAAQGILKEREMVLGVTIAGQSRAYPIRQLNALPEHKILNDTLAGRPLAATW